MPPMMKTWAKTIKTAIRLYRWKLLTFTLALAILIFTKRYVIATELPPGSIPTPDIDPL